MKRFQIDDLAMNPMKRSKLEDGSGNRVVTIDVAFDEDNPTMELQYRIGTDHVAAAQNFIYMNDLSDFHCQHIADFLKKHFPLPLEHRSVKEIVAHLQSRLSQAGAPSLRSAAPQSSNSLHALLRPLLSSLPVQHNSGSVMHVKPEPEPVIEKPKLTIDPNYPKNCDFTLTVNMGHGRMEVLGYNKGEDMELAAQRFCQHYSFSDEMIPRLVHFIKQSMPSMQEFHAKRQVASSNNESLCPNGDGYPMKELELFSACPARPDKAMDRLYECSAAQFGLKQLNPEELNMMIYLFFNTPISSAREFCQGIDKALFSWSVVYLLPIVDALRLALLDERCNSYYFSDEMRTKFSERLVEILLSDAIPAMKYVILRALCNAFKHPAGRNAICTDGKKWMGTVAKLLPEADVEQFQVLLSKFVGNYAVVLFPTSVAPAQSGSRAQILQSLVIILKRHTDDPFNFRFSEKSARGFLVALITLLWGDDEIVTLAKLTGILDVVSHFKDTLSEEINKDLAQELITMVHSL